MKKLNSLALFALMAPAVTLGFGSALAQEERAQPDPAKEEQSKPVAAPEGQATAPPAERQVGPTERDQGPHMVTMPESERTAAETEADKVAQQKRADEDSRQGADPSRTPVLEQDHRVTQGSAAIPRPTPQSYLTSKPANSFRVDQLIGSDLNSRTDNEKIGSIGDLVIDEDGQILAVIVEVGGFLGIGQKNVAIPWESVERTMNEKGDGYELHVSRSKEALTDAPEYKTDGKR